MRPLFVILLCCLLPLCHQPGPADACTSFCMDTPGGPVFGANCDLFIPGDGLVYVNRRGIAKEGYAASTTGETAKWTSVYGSVTLNLAGREFPWTGMNEAGLVMSTMQLMASECPDPDERPPLGEGYLIQHVLDTCATVAEVIAAVSLVNLPEKECTSHYLVADASGRGVGLEWLDGEFVYYTGENLPVRAMSNMPYGRALAAYERGGARWWESNPGRSAERFAGAADRAGNYDAGRDTCAVTYAFTTLTRVVPAAHTKWNVVHDLAKREIWFRSVESPTVKHVSLDAFDFACGDAPLMLDVNVQLEGDVEEAFTDYDHHVNLTVFRRFCDRWGIEVSLENAVGLMRFFESFECEEPEGGNTE